MVKRKKISKNWFYTSRRLVFSATWRLRYAERGATWESPQMILGYGYANFRNFSGVIDRIDYLGGATFITDENYTGKYPGGITFGNYININLQDEITGDFEEYVLTHPLYMHEYGHTIDSRRFGLSYLLAVGLPSLNSASHSTDVAGQPYSTHDIFWTELRANKRANGYFRKYYGITWNFSDYPLNK